jgi:hypothetical protein
MWRKSPYWIVILSSLLTVLFVSSQVFAQVVRDTVLHVNLQEAAWKLSLEPESYSAGSSLLVTAVGAMAPAQLDESEQVAVSQSKVLVAASSRPWQVAATLGILGVGVELSRAVNAQRSVAIQLQYGQLSSDRDLDDGTYSLTSSLRQVSVTGRFFPWGEGAYAQFGLVYGNHDGRGSWREYPLVLVDVANQQGRQAFDYHFPPWVVSLGVGWQGRWVPALQSAAEAAAPHFEFGFAFDLQVQGSAEVVLSPWVVGGVNTADAAALRSNLETDIDGSKVLPNVALRLAYVF